MDEAKEFSKITERLGATYKVTNTLKAYDERKKTAPEDCDCCIDYNIVADKFEIEIECLWVSRPITWYGSAAACEYVINNLDAELRTMYSVEDELWK